MADALFPKPAHLTNLSLSFAGEENEHKPFKPPTRPTRNKQVLLHEIDQKIAQLTCRNDNFCLPWGLHCSWKSQGVPRKGHPLRGEQFLPVTKHGYENSPIFVNRAGDFPFPYLTTEGWPLSPPTNFGSLNPYSWARCLLTGLWRRWPTVWVLSPCFLFKITLTPSTHTVANLFASDHSALFLVIIGKHIPEAGLLWWELIVNIPYWTKQACHFAPQKRPTPSAFHVRLPVLFQQNSPLGSPCLTQGWLPHNRDAHPETYAHTYIDLYIYIYIYISVCVCVCMYVWMDGWMDGWIYACMHVCMYACMHVCMYACMHVCMYACMHACMHVCMSACVHVCMSACLHVYMYACTHVRMYACTHVGM